jgi:2-hydroxy-4-(methylsulfanyl)butanoate S-methyltransferase
MTVERRGPGRPAMAVIDSLATAPYLTTAMFAAVDLGVFAALEAPSTASEAAGRLGVRADRLAILLWALVKAGLLVEDGGRFRNSEAAARYLVPTGADFLGTRLQMYRTQLEAVAQTAASIRTGVPQRHKDFNAMDDDELAEYYLGTHPATVASATRLLARFDLSGFTRLLDVGGGTGGLSITLTRALPGLRATVVDLERVTPITRRFVAEAGAADRVAVATVDVVRRPPPGRHDLAISRACLQVLGRDDIRRAIRNVGAAVEPGGTFMVVGAILDDSRLAPERAVSYNLLAVNYYDHGEAYTLSEYKGWLEQAGFGRFEHEMDGQDRLVVARKRR